MGATGDFVSPWRKGEGWVRNEEEQEHRVETESKSQATSSIVTPWTSHWIFREISVFLV